MSPFGATLADLMDERACSGYRLARGAGLGDGTISRLVRGLRAPERTTVLTLADALGCTARETDRLLMAAGYLPQSPAVRDVLVALVDDGTYPAALTALMRALDERGEA